MKKNNAVFIISILAGLSFQFNLLQAQYPGGGGGMGSGNGGGRGGNGGQGNITPEMIQKLKGMSVGHVFGKVVEAKTKKGIEFASVALYTLRTDSLVGGQLTESNGDFSLDNLPFGGFKLKVTYLGYADSLQRVIVTPKKSEQDLGNIGLFENTKTLTTVTVTADKGTVDLKPDRKVFNVDKDLSSRGGTAMDVMEKIPGVSVDGSGNVTLRNLTPIIYVDGKPTTLTMDQIPSDQIEKVEVITNPSAKYEADATGGIINVIMKKNNLPGYNGIVTAAVGTNLQYNGSALLNVREKKFGFMLSYNVHGSTSPTAGSTDRTDLNNDQITNYINESDQFILKRVFQTARVGFDGYINNHNTLSITQTATFGNFNTSDNATVVTDSMNKHLAETEGLNENQSTAFRNFNTIMSLTHTYVKPDKQWSLDFSYNRIHAGTNYLNTYSPYGPNGVPIPFDTTFNFQSQSQSGYTVTNTATAQWDFTDPINADMKLEFGGRSYYQRTYSTLTVTNTNIDSAFSEVSPSLSQTYHIDNIINAAYITFNHTIKGFSYQLGLRIEQTLFQSTDDSANHEFPSQYAYPSANPSFTNLLDCFFPSFMISQKLGEKHELQFNITRKINRPGFRQLAPFISNSTPYGYSVGNPALQPEFDNKAEINYDMSLNKFTWLSSIYGSYNQQPITQFDSTNQANNIQIISTYKNASNSWVYGWENTFKATPAKGFDIMVDANVFYTDINIKSNIDSLTVSNKGYSYVIKAILSYKFPLAIVAQVNGNYEAPKVIPQGHTLPLYWFDASLAKDFGIATLTLAVSDVLNTKTYGTYYNTPTYYETTEHRRDPRYARLGVTFRFGKMDSSLFRKKKKEQVPEQNPEDIGF